MHSIAVRTVPSLLLLLAAFASVAAAQGDDNCATAQPISGLGTFAFDNTAATTDGLPDNLCLAFGTSQIEEDVWWSWTAPSSGPFKIHTCSQTTVDTRIAVYDGTCAGAVLACNDDTCALQSSVTFAAVAGQSYVIRLGDFPGTAAPGTGTFTIASAIEVTAVSPVNGHTYHQLSSSGWSAAEASAVAMGGHLATVRSQAEHDWLNATFHNYLGVDIDLWIGMNDVALEGTFAWSSGEPVVYTNWDTGEPNNANGVEDYGSMRKNNPNAFWNDLADAPTGYHAGPHGIVEIAGGAFTSDCFGDGSVAPCPCANNGGTGRGCDNSAATGGAVLSAAGTTSPDTVVLTSSGELPSVPSIFLQGNSPIAPVAFGDGLRCAGGTLKRLYLKSASGGVVSAPGVGDPSITTQSASLGDPIAPGSSRHYQAYYRDPDLSFCANPPGNSWNVSSGVTIVW